MKKLISLLLALTMLAAIFAGCSNNNASDASGDPDASSDAAPEVVPASALEILENVWALYGDDEKFPVVGGDMNNMVDGAPGAFDVADGESLAYYFYLNQEQIASIDGAASLFHGMMLNNFTCGVFHVTGDVEAFVSGLHETLANNQWLCGMPEKMLISVVGGEYVLMAFGINDAMNPFEGKLVEAYPDAKVAYSEAIA